MSLVFCLCSSYIFVSGLNTKQGDSASLFGYRSCYDPLRVRELTFGIRAFALCVGSRLTNSVRVLVEEFSVVSFKIFEEQ